MNIQWYPGHMAKTKRLIEEHLTLVDIIIEIVDARCPQSSSNPIIHDLSKSKPKLLVFTKNDLADDIYTEKWRLYFLNKGYSKVFSFNLLRDSLHSFSRICNDILLQTHMKLSRPARIIILGIPNVGKSTFINMLKGKKFMKVENRPGVTRQLQWVSVDKYLELLDTPGVLWPKFEKQSQALRLAAISAIKDNLYSNEDLAFFLIEFLSINYSDQLKKLYKLEDLCSDLLSLINCIARNRGCILRGNDINYDRVYNLIIDDFRKGKFGRISLEFI